MFAIAADALDAMSCTRGNQRVHVEVEAGRLFESDVAMSWGEGEGLRITTPILQVNQLVELPTLRIQKKVKSMQVFRRPVSVAR